MRFRLVIFTCLVGLIPVIAHAASNTLDLTVKTTVTLGSCTTQVQDESHAPTSAISFGDANFSEVANKSKIKRFSLVFSGCAGLPKNQASVQLKPQSQANCDGAGHSGNGFANARTGGDVATGVSVEVWTTDTPQGGGSVQLACGNPVAQIVSVKDAGGSKSVRWPLSARLVQAQDATSSDLGTGSFSAPATFFITYQ